MSETTGRTIGVDVPWVVSWSGEPMTSIGPCPSVDGAVAVHQAEAPGRGEPQFNRNHLFRQRRAVREMLCPMCGQLTPTGDRWTQTGHWTTAGDIRRRNLGSLVNQGFADDRRLLDVGTIPPMHRACAERVRELCPPMKAYSQQELIAFPDAWSIATINIEAEPKPGYANIPQAPVVAITFLQLIGVPDWKG